MRREIEYFIELDGPIHESNLEYDQFRDTVYKAPLL